MEHGTYAGYSRHLRHDEKPCHECVQAQRIYKRQLSAAADKVMIDYIGSPDYEYAVEEYRAGRAPEHKIKTIA